MELKQLMDTVEYIRRHFVNPQKFLCRKFKERVGYELNLKSPQTFNEKLQWLKLYNKEPLYTALVDKCAVKDYALRTIGEEHIVPTLGVWEKFSDIDFDSLPNQFVLKCTHDSGSIVICKDKANFDIKKAKMVICHSLSRNFYYYGFEWPL